MLLNLEKEQVITEGDELTQNSVSSKSNIDDFSNEAKSEEAQTATKIPFGIASHSKNQVSNPEQDENLELELGSIPNEEPLSPKK